MLTLCKPVLFLCSSGTFLAAHQDATGSLDWVERAISEATMIPLEHGEVGLAYLPQRNGTGIILRGFCDDFKDFQLILEAFLLSSEVERGLD